MTTEFDLFTLIHSVKTIKKFISAEAWNDVIIGPYDPTWGGETDEEIEAYVRANGASIFHGTGTAAATAKNAPYGVVDPDLTVKGVEGVSIADTSVWVRRFSLSASLVGSYGNWRLQTVSPNAHTQGPAYMGKSTASDALHFSGSNTTCFPVAERAADLIRARFGL